MGRLTVRNKYLFDGDEKFLVRGVSYGTFAPNSRGEEYPEPERVAADFSLMRELGANVVRTYLPVPPWMLEIAAQNGLRIMVGIAWPSHIAFLDSRETVREVRNHIRKTVTEMRSGGDGILAYCLGNEIRSDIVRWHGPRAVSRFMRELYDIGKQADPDSLFTYANYPSAEYLDLNFFDFVSFNVYLHRETDFRRYLTHLLAISADRPVVLSETGMDTIREGEAHQAELLEWQIRATFELGLSGLIVFSFTDEWFRQGTDYTNEWAFGLTTRERAPKPSFARVAELFRNRLPPPLAATPKASVIVPVYNGASTLPKCLESLKRLNYPDYEVIVVNDGSADATEALAEAAGVRTVNIGHAGLSAARNAGLAAANGTIAAFIDADAAADRDWLYHLVEAMTRTSAPVVGGRNFPPPPDGTIAAALEAAPGMPHEVRAGDEQLAQVCGCSMALELAKFSTPQVFDPVFVRAGDDVDFSWRVRDQGNHLAYASGAVVEHERRGTIREYLKQQRGYGAAEGILDRKYPGRRETVYGYSGRFADWLVAGSRIYYGAFGRGLFQSVYPGSMLPAAAQLPLTAQWFGISVIMIVGGVFDRFFLVLGAIGIAVSLASAIAAATVTPIESKKGIRPRAVLALLWLAGPLVRSFERQRIRWSFNPDSTGAIGAASSSRVRLVMSHANGASASPPDADTLLESVHLALVRRRLAVAKGSRYDQFDLEIIVPPWVRVPILFLGRGSQISIGWRTRIEPASAAVPIALIFLLMVLAGVKLVGAAIIAAIVAIVAAAIAVMRARHVPRVISAAVAESAAAFGLSVEIAPR